MKRTSFFILLCFLFACNNPNKIPEDIIGISKMKFIVWDLVNAGEYAQLQNSNDSLPTLTKETTKKFQQVFAIYGITKDQFYKSYSYYEQHPDKNKILMDSVSNYAARKRTESYKKLE